ncbi:MAG: hypothetical protein RR485_00570 [Mucinivorans sp.]
MRRGLVTLGLTFCLSLFSLCVVAQDGASSSVFSPYTMYGIGELSVGGTTANRLMGGVGLGIRRSDVFNYMNPASLSAIARKSAIFNFGGMAVNNYSQTLQSKTSFSSFNMHDLGLAFPLARGVGFGFSLTPVSDVGYSSYVIDNNQSVIENIGRSVYTHSGEGGVSALSAHLGVMVFRGLSLGLTANYNFGVIDRYYNTDIYSLLDDSKYRSVKTVDNFHVSQFNFNIGLQYSMRVGPEAALTLGVTYSPRSNSKARQSIFSASMNEGAFADTLSYSKNEKVPFALPEKFAGGLFFVNKFIGVGVDYSYQDWAGAFDIPADQNTTMGAKHDVRFGVQYTPDRYSIRKALARWTYKIGVRYTNSYVMRNNYNIDEYAVSLGVDIPLKLRSASAASVGFEFGQRGAKVAGQAFEQYWKVFLGVSLFGDDGWFQRRKFN